MDKQMEKESMIQEIKQLYFENAKIYQKKHEEEHFEGSKSTFMKFLERDEKFSLKANFEGIEDTNIEWNNILKRLDKRINHRNVCESSDCSSMEEEMSDVLKTNQYVMKMIELAREAKVRNRMKNRLGELGII
jgi:hypothetical protein